MNRGVEKARLFRDGDGPGRGPRHDFRQRLPTGHHAECLEEIKGGERPWLTGARLPEHHFLNAVVVAVTARTRTVSIGANVLLPMRQWGTGGGKPRPGSVREEDRTREVTEGLIEFHGEAPYHHFCFWSRLPGVTHDGGFENPRLFVTGVALRVRDAGESKPV